MTPSPEPAPELERYLSLPMAAVAPEVEAALAAGPIAPALATSRQALDSLLDPDPLPAETGWCTLADGVGYVAVRTEMPGVTAGMIEWWFDWHPRDPLRYRVWCPGAHHDITWRPAPLPRARPLWGAVHWPVEDVGRGVETIRIGFVAPSEIGFSGDLLEHPQAAVVVAGLVADPRLRMRTGVMTHVFLRAADGLALRSRFWLGAGLRPDGPAPVGAAGAWLLNRRLVRSLAIPAALPRALAEHCATEYAHLASILPGLHARYG